MFFVELMGGVILLIAAIYMLRVARPKSGIRPRFLQNVAVETVYAFTCLLLVVGSGFLFIHPFF